MVKIQMSMEGVETLREFAKAIPDAMERIKEQTEALSGLYGRLEEAAGPHADLFRQMFRSVEKSRELMEEAFYELPYALNSTADKMEAYIKRRTPAQVRVLNKNRDLKSQYESGIRKRLNDKGTIPEAKKLYAQYSGLIRIADYEYEGTAYYSGLSKSICLNAAADTYHPTGAMSTYFHEVGHMLDDSAGNGHTWISSDPEFAAFLREDAEAYLLRTQLKEGCDREGAYDTISEEICGHELSGVSDIFGSLTEGRCQGDWGHSRQYWREDASRVEKEAFANMFEASIGDGRKAEAMRRYFPSSYERFLYLIRSAL